MYLFWVAGEDEETQRRGLVCVLSRSWEAKHAASSRNWEAMVRERLRKGVPRDGHAMDVWQAQPVRISSYHICLPDRPFFHLNASFYALILLRSSSFHNMARINFHVGAFTCAYACKIYIPHPTPNRHPNNYHVFIAFLLISAVQET